VSARIFSGITTLVGAGSVSPSRKTEIHRARPGGKGKPKKTLRARDKVLSRENAGREIRRAQSRGEKVVFTNGCFDVLHVGHLRSFEEARGLGDRLVVAVNSDASVRRLKGKDRPVVGQRQRAEMIAGLECVDWVVVFGASTPLATIEALRPNVLAKGGDWSLDSIVGREEVESWGGRVVRLREIPGVRTTILISKVRGESR
jgi:rfaE bifunctional protein nucleotidyltransferase chain/domain